MTVAENLKRIRIEKGLTQKKLAELCGISEGMIRQYELGLRNPKIETLKKLANALDTDIYILDNSLFARVMFHAPIDIKKTSSKGQDLSNIIDMIESLGFNYVDILENDVLSVAFDDGIELDRFYVSLEEINKIITKYEKEKLNKLKVLLTKEEISIIKRNIQELELETNKVYKKLNLEMEEEEKNKILNQIQDLRKENERLTKALHEKTYSLVQSLQDES